MKSLKIKNKVPHPSGYEGFHLSLSDGSEWSVLNFADSMKNHPSPEGLYLGWEGLNEHGINLRAETYGELLNIILNTLS